MARTQGHAAATRSRRHAAADKPARAGSSDSLQDVVKTAVLSGLPIVAALTFVAVTIKVFRVARMETATTVAIVSSADPVVLLKGVIVSLLPGFLAGMIALGVWQWATAMPAYGFTVQDGRRALSGPRAGLLATLLIIGFFTVPSFAYLLICLPVLAFIGVVLSGLLRPWCRARFSSRILLCMLCAGSLAGLVILIHVTGLSAWYLAVFGPVALFLAALVLSGGIRRWFRDGNTLARRICIGCAWVVPVLGLLVVGLLAGVRFADVLVSVPGAAFLVAVLHGMFHDWYREGLRLARAWVVALSAIVAMGSILYLAVSPDVWLPMREIMIKPNQAIVVARHKTIPAMQTGIYHHQVAAYVLNDNGTEMTLLLASPRAVVTIKASSVDPDPLICNRPPAGWRPILLRPSQILKLQKDYGSPYEICLPSR
jgi:hypothetical protein